MITTGQPWGPWALITVDYMKHIVSLVQRKYSKIQWVDLIFSSADKASQWSETQLCSPQKEKQSLYDPSGTAEPVFLESPTENIFLPVNCQKFLGFIQANLYSRTIPDEIC